VLSMERGICRPVGLSMVGHEIDLVPERMQALLFLEVVDSDGELLENCVDISGQRWLSPFHRST